MHYERPYYIFLNHTLAEDIMYNGKGTFELGYSFEKVKWWGDAKQ